MEPSIKPIDNVGNTVHRLIAAKLKENGLTMSKLGEYLHGEWGVTPGNAMAYIRRCEYYNLTVIERSSTDTRCELDRHKQRFSDISAALGFTEEEAGELEGAIQTLEPKFKLVESKVRPYGN